jgi:ornithine carbamoyltransferase
MSFNLQPLAAGGAGLHAARFRYLLDLARDLKRANAPAPSEAARRQGICLIFEKTPRPGRGAPSGRLPRPGRARHLPRSTGSQIGHRESFKDTARVLGRMCTPSVRGANKKGSLSWGNGPASVFNSLTATPPHADARRRHDDARAATTDPPDQAPMGDTRNNMGHSLMIAAA